MNALIALLVSACVAVESGNNAAAIGDNGQAVGILQIHPACIQDVNRFGDKVYTLEDRTDREKSIEIFTAYLTHYGRAYERRTGKKPTAEVLARIWNGGPRGYAKTATLPYWRKVQAAMKKK